MAEHAELELTFRLVPADDRPADPVVLDDIVRLIRQAVATAPKDAPRVTAPPGGFREPESEEEKRDLRNLVSRVENRIQQASAASQAAVEKRAELARQPDAQQKLADNARAAAERVVAAVQRALLRGVAVGVPDAGAS